MALCDSTLSSGPVRHLTVTSDFAAVLKDRREENAPAIHGSRSRRASKGVAVLGNAHDNTLVRACRRVFNRNFVARPDPNLSQKSLDELSWIMLGD
jgi:hypothetical protein